MNLNEAIQIMTGEIISILANNKPTFYLFGSVALGAVLKTQENLTLS